MKLVCEMAEFRGMETRVDKKTGNNVYRGNFEDENGKAFSLYLGQDNSHIVSLKKADKVNLKLTYNQEYKYFLLDGVERYE